MSKDQGKFDFLCHDPFKQVLFLSHKQTDCQLSAISASHLEALLRLSLKAESRNLLLPLSGTCANSQSAHHSQLQQSLDYVEVP